MPELYALQSQDARQLAGWRFGIHAGEPGTGKTPILLRAAQQAAPAGPWHIVTVRNAVQQWQEELYRWAPRTWLAGGKVSISHWEQLDKPAVQQSAKNAAVLMLDELHTARNMETEAFKLCLPLTRAPGPRGVIKRVWGATGYPVVNGPDDLIGESILVGAFEPSAAWSLRARYTNPQLGGFRGTVDYRGSANLGEMKNLVSGFMLRRRFADYGMQMPAVSFTNWAVTPDPGKLGSDYTAAAADFSGWYAQTRGRQVPPLARFTTLRRMLSRAKVPAVAEKLKAEMVYGYKILVFSEFLDTVKDLHAMFPGSGLIIGSDTPGQREISFAASKNSPAGHITFATAGSLNEARNMQQITRVYYVDMGWTPAGFGQTLGRSWRYLQRMPVSVLRFFIENDPLENFIVGTLLGKTKMLVDLGLEPTSSLQSLGLR